MNSNGRQRSFGTLALLTIAIWISGCAVAGPAVKAGTAALSAAGAWWSYKALQQDPVQVTTLAPECIWYAYQTATPAERAYIPETVLAQIRENNKLAVRNCPDIRKAWCERHPDGEECEVR